MLERINQKLESELELRQKENEYKRALEEMEKEKRRAEIENKVYQRIQDRNDCKEIMIERTRQITYNYKSVTPVIVANVKHKQVLEQQKRINNLVLDNPLQGYDAISARYNEIMSRKKDEIKRKRAFVELQEVTRNIANKVSQMPNNIPMVAQDLSAAQLRQDTLVKMQILAEKRKQSEM